MNGMDMKTGLAHSARDPSERGFTTFAKAAVGGEGGA
jgi:hypothetical protein